MKARIARIAENIVSGEWISADQMEKICASCAEKMRKQGIARVRASVVREAMERNTSLKFAEAPVYELYDHDKEKVLDSAEMTKAEAERKNRKLKEDGTCKSCQWILQVEEDRLSASVKTAAWEKLPKGWTEESARKFWDSLTGERVHKITACMKRLEGSGIDDLGAFCGSLASYLGER